MSWFTCYLRGLTYITACISNYMPNKVYLWNYLSFPKFQRCNRSSLGLDEFYPTFYNGCNYLSILGLNLIHVSKMGHWWTIGKQKAHNQDCDDKERNLVLIYAWWQHPLYGWYNDLKGLFLQIPMTLCTSSLIMEESLALVHSITRESLQVYCVEYWLSMRRWI